jgi:8-oxo-dGTP diphosphatase
MPIEKKYCYNYPRPAMTVDIVVFTILDSDLKILLIERGIGPFIGSWALPGGFINENETTYHAAERELYEETNLEVADLQQFYVASGPDRDPRGWTISIVYMCFISDARMNVNAGDDAKSVKWFSVNNMPPLAFDHGLIINESMKYLLKVSRFSIVGMELLPNNFKLTELKSLYIQIGNSIEQTKNLVKRLMDKNAISNIENEFFTFNMRVCDILKEKGFCFDLSL